MLIIFIILIFIILNLLFFCYIYIYDIFDFIVLNNRIELFNFLDLNLNDNLFVNLKLYNFPTNFFTI